MYEYEIRNAVSRKSDPAMLYLRSAAVDYVKNELKGETRLVRASKEIIRRRAS